MMDLLDAVAVVSGLVGAVLGGLGWWKARAATAAAVACLGIAEARTVRTPMMAGVADEHEGGEVTGNPMPQVARKLERVRGGANDAQTANLVMRPGSAAGQDVPTNQGSGSGLIGVFVVNEGPAVARELRLSATFPDGVVRSSETYRSLSAHKEMTLFTQVLPQDFGSGSSMDVFYRVAYRDGNGEQVLERKVRLDGGWKGPWKTFLDADIGASVAPFNDDALSAPNVNPTRE
jgi:hypothetical protein